MAVTLDMMEYATDKLAQDAYVSSDDAFLLQLREHKYREDYDPDITFTKPNNSIKCDSSQASLAFGFVFACFPPSFLDGRKIKITWETSSSLSTMQFRARIYDGAYDRTSEVDFPEGSEFLKKGAELLQVIEDLLGTNASHTTAVTVDVSGAQLDTVTILIWVADSWAGQLGHFIVTGLSITDTSDNVLWSADLPGALDMEQTGTFSDYGIIGAGDINLTCFSEDTIKEQGSYSLKGIAKITNSLNDTLTRTVDPTIDLTGQPYIRFYIRASRTGSNIKIGIRDAGGVTSEVTPNITSANAWQVAELSGIATLDKDAIDRIIATIINADSDNIFYLDNMFADSAVALEENLAMLESLPTLARALTITESLALLESLPVLEHGLTLEELLALKEEETADVSCLLTESLAMLESLPTLERALTLEESLALLEALTEESRTLTLEEALALLESLPALERALTLEEALALKETETADIQAVMTESLALKEDLTQLGRALTLEESLALLEDAHAETLLFEVDKDGNIIYMGTLDEGAFL